MVDDTKNCDEVGAYLERICPELKDGVLVIHTKKNGEISEASGSRDKDELERLRKQANEIDSPKSPFKAIVSVLMLKEGWDVRNVTVIVGLRAYVSEAKILPEQTLGRGLRRRTSMPSIFNCQDCRAATAGNSRTSKGSIQQRLAIRGWP